MIQILLFLGKPLGTLGALVPLQVDVLLVLAKQHTAGKRLEADAAGRLGLEAQHLELVGVTGLEVVQLVGVPVELGLRDGTAWFHFMDRPVNCCCVI